MKALRSTNGDFGLSSVDMGSKELTITIRVVFLANRTTHVELRDGKRIFGEKEDHSLKKEIHASFAELMDDGVKLDVPPRICANGHRLEFELEFTAPNQPPIRFNAQGVVNHAEVFVHDHDNVTVTFTRHEDAEWKRILGLYQNKQNEILALFTGLKGAVP
jgi:hypothetical protein